MILSLLFVPYDSKRTSRSPEVIKSQQQPPPRSLGALPESRYEASLEFKLKNLPLPPSLLFCQVVILPLTTHQLVTETSNYCDNSSPGSWKRIPGLGFGAVAKSCLSVWFTLMVHDGGGVSFL